MTSPAMPERGHRPAVEGPRARPRRLAGFVPSAVALAGTAGALGAVWRALEAIAGRDYVGAVLGLGAGVALFGLAVEALRIAAATRGPR